ncbi:MAG: hypothetical protein K2Y14_01530 [Burkholderiales bacterium]|nr:hypothetical protein [Burkholderiales bacterium]
MTYLESLLITVLSSSVVAAFISKLSKDKTDKLQYITGERKQWRTDLRYAVVALRQLYQSKKTKLEYKTQICGGLQFTDYEEAKSWFIVRLNPLNTDELSICNKIGAITSDKDIEFIEHDISFILKSDWERVKNEVSLIPKIFSWFKRKLTKKNISDFKCK